MSGTNVEGQEIIFRYLTPLQGSYLSKLLVGAVRPGLCKYPDSVTWESDGVTLGPMSLYQICRSVYADSNGNDKEEVLLVKVTTSKSVQVICPSGTIAIGYEYVFTRGSAGESSFGTFSALSKDDILGENNKPKFKGVLVCLVEMNAVSDDVVRASSRYAELSDNLLRENDILDNSRLRPALPTSEFYDIPGADLKSTVVLRKQNNVDVDFEEGVFFFSYGGVRRLTVDGWFNFSGRSAGWYVFGISTVSDKPVFTPPIPLVQWYSSSSSDLAGLDALLNTVPFNAVIYGAVYWDGVSFLSSNCAFKDVEKTHSEVVEKILGLASAQADYKSEIEREFLRIEDNISSVLSVAVAALKSPISRATARDVIDEWEGKGGFYNGDDKIIEDGVYYKVSDLTGLLDPNLGSNNDVWAGFSGEMWYNSGVGPAIGATVTVDDLRYWFQNGVYVVANGSGVVSQVWNFVVSKVPECDGVSIEPIPSGANVGKWRVKDSYIEEFLPDATQNDRGFMSAADKKRLDGIEDDAQKNPDRVSVDGDGLVPILLSDSTLGSDSRDDYFFRGDGSWSKPPVVSKDNVGFMNKFPDNISQFLRGDGSWFPLSVFSLNQDGFVPAPTVTEDQSKFLRGDGVWANLGGVLSDYTYVIDSDEKFKYWMDGSPGDFRRVLFKNTNPGSVKHYTYSASKVGGTDSSPVTSSCDLASTTLIRADERVRININNTATSAFVYCPFDFGSNPFGSLVEGLDITSELTSSQKSQGSKIIDFANNSKGMVNCTGSFLKCSNLEDCNGTFYSCNRIRGGLFISSGVMSSFGDKYYDCVDISNIYVSFTLSNGAVIASSKESSFIFSNCRNISDVSIFGGYATGSGLSLNTLPVPGFFQDCHNLTNVAVSFSVSCHVYDSVSGVDFSKLFAVFNNCSSLAGCSARLSVALTGVRNMGNQGTAYSGVTMGVYGFHLCSRLVGCKGYGNASFTKGSGYFNDPVLTAYGFYKCRGLSLCGPPSVEDSSPITYMSCRVSLGEDVDGDGKILSGSFPTSWPFAYQGLFGWNEGVAEGTAEF